MLVLTRNPGEGIILQGDSHLRIRVSVESVKGCRVQLGITAPQEIEIMREELDCYPNARKSPPDKLCSACGEPATVQVYYSPRSAAVWCEEHWGDW